MAHSPAALVGEVPRLGGGGLAPAEHPAGGLCAAADPHPGCFPPPPGHFRSGHLQALWNLRPVLGLLDGRLGEAAGPDPVPRWSVHRDSLWGDSPEPAPMVA